MATGTVHGILADAQLRPHKVSYCCERRDAEFGPKTRNVPLLYRRLSMRFGEDGNVIPWEDGQEAHVLPYDEKPGNQAISDTATDLRP